MLAAVIFAGCVSIQAPVAHDKSFPPDGRYEILGPVSCSGETIGVLGLIWIRGVSYSGLLDAAAEKYEGADDVVNVSVDRDIMSIVGLYTSIKTTLRGTAIRYVTAPPAAR